MAVTVTDFDSPASMDGIRRALETARRELLDLTLRNRLISFRHTSRSTLRVIDEVPDQLYERLTSEKGMIFRAVPKPAERAKETFDADITVISEEPRGRASRSDQRLREEARRHGLNPDYELPTRSPAGLDDGPSKHTDSFIQTLMFPDDLEASLRTLARTAKTAIEETGSNMLHLVFGFLEWYERDDAETPHLAPLFIVPVSLTRGAPDPKTKTYQYELRYTGEEIAPNYSLQEKLRRDFARELPEPSAEDTPEKYLETLSAVFADLPRWRVRRSVTLCILQFGKILLHRDLDPRRWPAGTGPDKHPVVRTLIEGADRPSETPHAEEHRLDTLDERGALPEVVLDADSSQHSALVDAMSGKNLVIEGPPGTGKSQTIANLIAAAMAAGKTVLFVAEKLAALSVVRERLDKAGLGTFSIELHSSKGSAALVHRDLRERLEKRTHLHEPRELDQRLNVLRQVRRDLSAHVATMNEPYGARGLTPFEIIWKYEALRGMLGEHRRWLDEIDLAGAYVTGMTIEHHEWLRRTSLAFAASLEACLRGGALGEHPWAGVGVDTGHVNDVELLRPLQALREATVAISEAVRVLTDATAVPVHSTVSYVESLTNVFDQVANTPLSEPAAAWIPFVRTDPQAVDSLCVAYSNYASRVASLRARGVDIRVVTNRLGEIAELHAAVAREANPRSTLSVCAGIGARATATAERLRRLLALRNELAMALGLEPAERALELAHTPVLLDLACSAPHDAIRPDYRFPDAEAFDEELSLAAREVEALRAERAQLSERFNLESADATALRQHAAVARAAGFFRFFSSDWRAAKRAYRALRSDGEESDRTTMARDFDAVATHQEAVGAFESRTTLAAGLGQTWRGLATDFGPALAVRAWQNTVTRKLRPFGDRASRDARLLLRAEGNDVRQASHAAQGATGDVRADLEALRGALPTLNDAFDRQGPASAIQRLDSLGALFDGARIIGEVLPAALTVAEAGEVLSACRDLLARETALASHPAATHLGEAAANGGAIRLLDGCAAQLAEAAAFTIWLQATKLPAELEGWILATSTVARCQWLRSWSAHAQRLLGAADQAHATFVSVGRVDLTTWYAGVDWRDLPLARLSSRTDAALRERDALASWLDFLRSRAALSSFGLYAVVGNVAARVVPSGLTWPVCEYVFFHLLVREMLVANPRLQSFSGTSHEELRSAFRRVDEECLTLYRQRAAARIDSRPAPVGVSRGPVSALTELSLIQHETNKQRRHIAVRQLVKRAANALVALKPCFMMSPQSVAQFLEPGAVTFDLVVMDEASQLRPEDALGAIARGRQLVVVGDTKQLPPTSFFASRVDEEDVETEEERPINRAESILEAAAAIFQPARQLRWHYRSRHESLIAFSNKHFYENNLYVFPAPAGVSKDLGVSLECIEHGTWDGKKNEGEARIVIERMLDHLRRKPTEKLGIVAMNVAQQQFLQDEAERRLQEDQQLLQRFDENVFIKNLENVQGDEADVIFISMTYAPDEGKAEMHQRFGPIAGKSGPRRLNVLFTRARRQIVVFSSFDPSMMKADATASLGVQLLKSYLEFAKNGSLDSVRLHDREPGSDFERSVAAALKRRGIDTVPQVGVARYFIDLGIRHPHRPGDFILGVECDGATYHSSYSARDRDRLRQSVLEGLGWELHRIWSTDWFRQPERQVERIVERVEQLLARERAAGAGLP